MFNIGDNIKIIKDEQGDWFTGSEGIIEDIAVNKDANTIYGVRINKQGNNLLYEIDNVIYYFLAKELELVKGE